MSKIVRLVLLFLAALSAPVQAETYALKAVTLRALPFGAAKAVDGVDSVDANQSLVALESKPGWVRARMGVDVMGWLPADVVSQRWIKVWKRERKLFLMNGDNVERSFRVALGSQNPTGQKVKRGDDATPEGRFFIAERDESPEPGRYGARSMRLSYPSAADARRGLRDHLIDKSTYLAIVRAVAAGEVPPQHTALGGSIRIHGGGSRRDWTLGCIALDDEDAIALFAQAPKGTRVDVYASAEDEARQGQAGFLATTILAAAKQQLQNPRPCAPTSWCVLCAGQGSICRRGCSRIAPCTPSAIPTDARPRVRPSITVAWATWSRCCAGTPWRARSPRRRILLLAMSWYSIPVSPTAALSITSALSTTRKTATAIGKPSIFGRWGGEPHPWRSSENPTPR